MAYVYAADQGLQLQNETVDAIMYDDAALLLMVIKGGVVFAYDLALDVPAQHEQLVWTYPLQEGPPVVCARCSFDRRSLALQRSKVLIELVDLPTGNISVMHSDKGRSDLLGMFLSEWPDAQLVLLSKGGLEMCTFSARRQGIHSRERLRMPVHWFQYSHETRCCLVATGPPLGPPYLQAWQFLPSGLVTLPAFTLSTSSLGTAPSPSFSGTANISERLVNSPPAQTSGLAATQQQDNDNELPSLPISTHATMGDDVSNGNGARGGRNGAGSAGVTSQHYSGYVGDVKSRLPVGSLTTWLGGDTLTLGAGAGAVVSVPGQWTSPAWPDMTSKVDEVVPMSAVRLLKMYGRVFCAHINSATRKLDLHRLFTDTVVLQHSYDIPTSCLHLSVVDNVLLVHRPSTCSAMIIDVCADPAHPVVPMRPLGHLAPLRRPRQLHEERLQQQQLQRQSRGGGPTGSPSLDGGRPVLPTPTAWSVVDEEEGALLPHTAWRFHLPNLIVDVNSQVIYRILLDLHAIASDCCSPAVLAAFLQRRRAPRLHVQSLDEKVSSRQTVPDLPHAQSMPMLHQTSLNPPSTTSPAASAPPNALVTAYSSSAPSAPEQSSLTSLVVEQPTNAPDEHSKTARQLPVQTSLVSLAELREQQQLKEIIAQHGQQGGNVDNSARASITHPIMLSGVVSPKAITSKLLLIRLVARMLKEELPLTLLRELFDSLNKGYSEVALAAASGRASPAAAACVLSPSEVVSHVLVGMCGGTLTPHTHRYLQAAVCELTSSVLRMGILPPDSLQLLGLRLLAAANHQQQQHDKGSVGQSSSIASSNSSEEAALRQRDTTMLARVLYGAWNQLYGNLQPGQLREIGGAALGGVALAHQVLNTAAAAVSTSIAPNPTLSKALRPSLDEHQQNQRRDSTDTASGEREPVPDDSGAALVRKLIDQGRVITAAKMIRDLKITSVNPNELAAAAGKANDLAALASVYRCFRNVFLPTYPSFQSLQQAVLNH